MHLYSLSIYNSIRVEHGDYLEDVGFSQAGCECTGAHQELQRALHYPAGVGLSRVHSGRQEDQWTVPWRGRNRESAAQTQKDGVRKKRKGFFHLKFFTADKQHQWTTVQAIWEVLACSDTPGLFSRSDIHPHVPASISERGIKSVRY